MKHGWPYSYGNELELWLLRNNKLTVKSEFLLWGMPVFGSNDDSRKCTLATAHRSCGKYSMQAICSVLCLIAEDQLRHQEHSSILCQLLLKLSRSEYPRAQTIKV